MRVRCVTQNDPHDRSARRGEELRGRNSSHKKVSRDFGAELGFAPFPALLVQPPEVGALLQDVLSWTVGLHRGTDRSLPAAQTGLEVLVRIQTVCFVSVLASGPEELWEMGR